MNIVLLTKVRQLFNVDYVPRSTNRHNQRQYIKALRLLGDKWLTHPNIVYSILAFNVLVLIWGIWKWYREE